MNWWESAPLAETDGGKDSWWKDAPLAESVSKADRPGLATPVRPGPTRQPILESALASDEMRQGVQYGLKAPGTARIVESDPPRGDVSVGEFQDAGDEAEGMLDQMLSRSRSLIGQSFERQQSKLAAERYGPGAASHETRAMPAVAESAIDEGPSTPQMSAYEPSVFDRINEWFASDSGRARASNELFAQERAKETGKSVDQVYRELGGARPMINPEGRPAPRAAAQSGEVLADQVPHIPADVANTVLRTIRGGDTTSDDSGWLDRAIKATDPEQAEFSDPNYDSFRGVGQSIGFSVVNLGASIAGAAAGNLVAPGVGTAAGVAAGGSVAYRGQFDQFMSNLKEKADQESIARSGEPLSQDEWGRIYDHYKNSARQYGLAEAVTEPVGNMIIGSMIAKKAVGGAAKGEVGKKLADLFGAELATETATQVVQSDAEVDAGLSKERSSVGEALREVAVPTLLTSGVLGGGAAAISQVRNATGSPVEAPADDSSPVEGSEQQGAAQTPTMSSTTETSDDQEASQGLGTRPGPQRQDAVRGPEAEAAQQREPGGRAERRAGNERTADPAEQSVSDTPSSEGVFDSYAPGDAVRYTKAGGEEVEGTVDRAYTMPSSIDSDQAERPVLDVRLPTGETQRIDASRAFRLDDAAPTEPSGNNAPVDLAAREAAESLENDRPTPTDAQKAAGNYKKGSVRIAGLDVAIENPNGSTRTGTDRDGKKWRSKMVGHYGYVKRTEGNDGDAVDVYIKPGTQDADTAYVIDQYDEDGNWDEHKTVLGADSIEDARATYRANYPAGWKGDKTVTAMPIDQFRDWLKNGDLSQPAAPQRKVPPKSLRKADREMRATEQTAIPDATIDTNAIADAKIPERPKGLRRRDRQPVDVDTELRDALREAEGVTPAWQQPRAAFYRNPDNAGIDHEQTVREAVDSGESVPADVLVDYPDLVADPADQGGLIAANKQSPGGTSGTDTPERALQRQPSPRPGRDDRTEILSSTAGVPVFSRRDQAPSENRQVSITQIDPPKIPASERWRHANDYYRKNLQGKRVYNESLDGEIVFSSEGRKESLHKGRRDARRMGLVQGLEDVASRAVVYDQAADRAGRPDTPGFKYAVAPVEIEGETYAIRLTLKENVAEQDSPRFYDLVGYDVEKPGAIDRGRVSGDTLGVRGSPGRAISMQSLVEAVNGKPKFSRQWESSADAASAVSNTQEETADVERLRSTLETYLGIENADVRPAAVSSDSASAARELAPLFGKRVVFFQTSDPQIAGFNGLALPDNSEVVYLNANAEVAHTALLGHELTHYLKRDRPDLWSHLERVANDEMQNVPEYRDWLNRLMANEGYQANEELVREEIIADFIGDQFLKPSFWTQVMDQAEPGVAQRLAGTIRKFLDNVLQWLNQRGFGSSRYVADIQRVRDAAAEAFAEYARASDRKGLKRGRYAASRERDVSASRKSDRQLHNVSAETARKAGLRDDKRSMADRVVEYLKQPAAIIREDMQAMSDNAKQKLFDRFHAIKVAEQRTLGRNIPAEQSAYVAARLSTGTASVMRGLLMHGAPVYENSIIEHKPGTQGLLEILAPVKGDLNDWLGWMVGRRANRLMKEGRENNFTQQEINELLSLNKGREEAFQKVAGDYAQFKTDVLDVAEAAGLIDAETRPAWDMADHIPFFRSDKAQDQNESKGPSKRKGMSHQESGVKTLRGGSQALNDPLENIILNFTHLMDASLKNMALKRTIDNLDGTAYIESVGYQFGPVMAPMDALRKDLESEGVDVASLPDDVMKGMRKILAMHPPRDKDVVRVMIDGKPKFYRVKDPGLITALTAVDEKALPTGVFRWFKQLLTGAVTADPSFILRNFIRDTLHAWTINEDSFVPIVDSFRGLGAAFKESESSRTMMFAGASFQGGYLNANDPGEVARSVRRALRAKGYSASHAKNFMSTVVDSHKRLWEMYRDFGDAVENANREAVYRAAINAGKSKAQAAYESKDLMDYSMRGSWVVLQALTDMVPFLNARLQGLYKLGRAGAIPGPKMRLAVAMRGSAIMVATLALYGLNRDDERYKGLEDWDKDLYWHFWLGDHHFRLPKPFEIGLIYGMAPERAIRLADGADDPAKTAERVAAGFTQTLSFNPIPQAAMPWVEQWANKSFFTSRDIESPSDEGKLTQYRYSAHTSDTARLLSKYGGASVGLSPKEIEHLVEGYTGTLGGYALSMADLVVRQIQGAPPRPATGAARIPLLNAVYRGKREPYRTRYINELYDAYREAQEVNRTVNELYEKGDYDQADAEIEKHQRAYYNRRWLNRTVRAMRDINNEIDEIYRDPNMTSQEKSDAIEPLHRERNELARGVMHAYRED